jgi:cell division GTPase FtsZ
MIKILLIGLGQCGNRILDAVNKASFPTSFGETLVRYYSRQKFPSPVETLAINTAINDLKEMRYTKAKDRLHIPHLHGVGANRNIGKQVFLEHRDLILREISDRGEFDVAFLITSASGGTGSSFAPLLVNELKKHHNYKRMGVYSVVVLPFREEGTIYLQNSLFCLRELIESGIDGIILVDNQFLKQIGGDIKSAYDGINEMVAQRLLFLFEALNSEMMMVTDLGDFKTVMAGGTGLATIGYSVGDKKTPIRNTIQASLSPRGLLFAANPFEDAARAMIVIQGERKYLNIDDITREVERLASRIGHVFKGIMVKKGQFRVLSVISLEKAPELDRFYIMAVDAIHKERERKQRLKEKTEVFPETNDLQPYY